MNAFTEEQVHSLAPDTASVKAAQKVYAKTTWEVFKSDRVIWTAIKGSGKKPYLTQLDLENIAFKCSCPSRKFPCKHGLSLALFLANHTLESVDLKEEPLWVKEWIDKRRKKSVNVVAKAKKPIDAAVVKQKSDTKWKDAMASIDYLDLWLRDLVKNGLIDLSTKPYAYFDNLSKRLVDFKLSGINTFVRAIQFTDFGKVGWENRVLKQIHLLNLIIKTVKNHENLKPDFKKELGMLLGWNIKKEEILLNRNAEIVDDVWMTINVISQKDENLTSRKVYLYGVTSNRWAYILDFSFGGAGFADSYIKGQKIQAKLAMYPGVHKTRAILKMKGGDVDLPFDLKPVDSFSAANEAFINRKIEFPFTFEMPLLIASAKLTEHNNVYYLVNDKDEILPCNDLIDEKFFKVLSITKGRMFDVFVVMNDVGVSLLAVFINDKIFTL